MKRLVFILIMLLIPAVCSAYLTKNNWIHGILAEQIDPAETTGEIISITYGDNSKVLSGCSSTNPCRIVVYDASCSTPSSCANREIIDMQAGDATTFTIKTRNAEETCSSCTFTIGAKFAMVGTVQSDPTYAGYLSLTEISPPGTAPSNTTRIYAEDVPTGHTPAGYSVLSFVDDTGMVRKLVRDSVIIVHNGVGSIIEKGQAVYHQGTVTGGLPDVAKADASVVAKMPAICITAEEIAAGGVGRCMQVGLLENALTTNLTAGQPIFVSATDDGALVDIAPVAPNYSQQVGTSLYEHASTGIMQVVVGVLQQNETGTRQNDFSIGAGTASPAKRILFNGAVDGILSWTPTSATKTVVIPDDSGTMLIADGRSLTAANGTIGADAELYTDSISFNLENPTTSDNGKFLVYVPLAITVTKIYCSVDSGSVTINMNERALATPDTTGTDVLSAGLVCDTDTQTSCASGCDVNTITNAGIDATDPFALEIDATSGSPTILRVTVVSTKDD